MPCNQKFPSTCITDQLLMHRTHAPTHIQIPPAPKSTKPPIPHFFQVHQPPHFPPSPINDNNLGSEHCLGCHHMHNLHATNVPNPCPTHSNLSCSGTNKTTNAPHFQVHQTPLISTFTYQYQSHSFLVWPGLAWPHLYLTSTLNAFQLSSPQSNPPKPNDAASRSPFTTPMANSIHNPIFAAQKPTGTQSTNQGSSTCNYMESNELYQSIYTKRCRESSK